MVCKANLIAAAVTIGVLAGCASVNRASEYQAIYADARNYSTAFEMQISLHPSENVLLINPRVYVLSGPYISPPEPGPELIRNVAAEFFGETGCTVENVRAMARPWFEAVFTCPADFDVRTAALAQREALRGGAPLRRAGAGGQ